MRHPAERRLLLAASLAVLAVMLGGCEDDDASPREPRSGFERALATIGEGVSPAGSGFGWVDLESLPDDQRRASRLALALGPGADDLLLHPAQAERALGVDPRSARRALSISGSYTLGVRLDGIAGEPLAGLLRAAGARERRARGWRLFDLGGFAESPVRGRLSPLGPYASRVAIGPESVVLARFGPARAALLGDGDSPLAEPAVSFAASCLGPVEAARTLPGTFTHNKATSPDLLAVGRKDTGTETICAIGDSAADAADQADSMRTALAPGARDRITGQPIAELARRVEVDTLADEGLSAARATLRPATRAKSGFVFGALVSGRLLTYTGSSAPISTEVARRLRRQRSD